MNHQKTRKDLLRLTILQIVFFSLAVWLVTIIQELSRTDMRGNNGEESATPALIILWWVNNNIISLFFAIVTLPYDWHQWYVWESACMLCTLSRWAFRPIFFCSHVFPWTFAIPALTCKDTSTCFSLPQFFPKPKWHKLLRCRSQKKPQKESLTGVYRVIT